MFDAETGVVYSNPEAPTSPLKSAVPSSGLPEKAPNPNSLLRLSIREKRSLRVEVLTESGVTVSYSAYHIERLMKRGEAYVDEQGRTIKGVRPPDAEVFMQRTMAHSAKLPVSPFPRDAAGRALALSLWPVVPRYSGRPLQDFLDTEARNRNQRPERAEREQLAYDADADDDRAIGDEEIPEGFHIIEPRDLA